MLKQRVITALVMVAVLLPALFSSEVWPFALVSLVLTSAAAWEWARLNTARSFAWPWASLLALTCAAAYVAGWVAAPPRVVWWTAALVWVLGGTAVLGAGPSKWQSWPRHLRCALGAALLWCAWLALMAAKTQGVNFILSLFCLVWAADIAAYFGGKAWGRRKLAPTVSPGKSWEGVWSGMAGTLILAAIWLALDLQFGWRPASLFTQLLGRFGPVGLALMVVFLASMSVVGDLFESLVKRAAGAKDSSGLLPGHGGVLDRVDAVLPVFPIAMALMSL